MPKLEWKNVLPLALAAYMAGMVVGAQVMAHYGHFLPASQVENFSVDARAPRQ